MQKPCRVSSGTIRATDGNERQSTRGTARRTRSLLLLPSPGGQRFISESTPLVSKAAMKNLSTRLERIETATNTRGMVTFEDAVWLGRFHPACMERYLSGHHKTTATIR